MGLKGMDSSDDVASMGGAAAAETTKLEEGKNLQLGSKASRLIE